MQPAERQEPEGRSEREMSDEDDEEMVGGNPATWSPEPVAAESTEEEVSETEEESVAEESVAEEVVEEVAVEEAPACIARGTYDWNTDAFSGNAYQRKSRSEKMSQLWDAITEVNTVICQQFDTLENLFIQDPRESFGNVQSDEMPGNRNKLVHQQGVVAQAEFISNGEHTYTGVFEGSDSILIRMSETDFFVDGVTGAANPSIALKFLRDGVPSAN